MGFFSDGVMVIVTFENYPQDIPLRRFQHEKLFTLLILNNLTALRRNLLLCTY